VTTRADQTAKKSRKREIFAKVSLVVIGMGLAFLLGEAYFRIAWPNSADLYEPDHVLGWKQKPNARGWLSSPGEYRTMIEINSKGLRSREIEYRPPTGTHRVLVLGDSFVQAVQVPLEKTFHANLEQRLNSSSNSMHWDVINAGVGGYATAEELLYLQNEGFRYQPDIVVLTFLLANDTFGNFGERTYDNIPRTRFELRDGKLVAVPATGALLKKDSEGVSFKKFYLDLILVQQFVYRLKTLPIVAKTAGRFLKPATPRMNDIYAPVYDKDTEKAWALTEALLIEMERSCQQHGAKLVVMIWPDNVQYDDGWWARRIAAYPGMAKYDRDKAERVLTEILQKNKITHFSLTSRLRQATREQSERLFLLVDQHPNAKAHSIVGESLYQYLVQNGMFDGKKD
jgi:hypothetical protein